MMRNPLILSSGMPRAGSGWFFELTHNLVVAAGGVDTGDIRDKYYLEKLLTAGYFLQGTLSFHRLLPVMIPLIFEKSYVIKNHAGRKPLADLFIKLGLIKPTYIYRDPRDAALSAYEYGQFMRSQGRTNVFSALTSIEEAIEFMDLYIRIGQGWLNLDSIYNIRYEDFLLNYEEKADELIRYVGIGEKESALVSVVDKYRPEKGPSDLKGTHFSEGKIGRHREVFSEQEKALCIRKFGSFLSEHGYET